MALIKKLVIEQGDELILSQVQNIDEFISYLRGIIQPKIEAKDAAAAAHDAVNAELDALLNSVQEKSTEVSVAKQLLDEKVAELATDTTNVDIAELEAARVDLVDQLPAYMKVFEIATRYEKLDSTSPN